MNKLGFAIKLASQGAGNAIECNKDQWTNKVVDIREYLKLFNGLQGTDNIVTFMSFDEGGCFLTQLRAISGRLGDFLSGWIYIPNTIEISVEDVLKAYNFVSDILSQSNLSDLKDKINDFFSEEYTQKNYYAQYQPSYGDEYGVRFLDQYYSLKEIIDKNRYQPYYSKHKAIFLINKNSEVKIAPEQTVKFKDLTKFPIEKTCIFRNPSLEDVRLLGKGVKIVFKDKREFVSPLLIKKGEEIQLFAIRDGFEAFPLPIVTIENDEQTLIISHETVRWQKRITTSMFSIHDDKNHSLDHIAHIYVNKTDITNHICNLSEDECKEADIVVMADDFEDKHLKANLLLGNKSIEMHRKTHEQQYSIMLKNGSIATMTIESKSIKSQYSKNDSPLEGYSYNYEHSALGLSSGYAWKQRLYGFVIAAILGISFLAYLAFDTWSKTHCFKFGLPPWEEIKYPEQGPNGFDESADDSDKMSGISASDSLLSFKNAIKYLDNNNIWVKTDMDKYPGIRGLFDDLNNFELDTIANSWSLKLQTSETLKRIIDVANKNRQNGWEPRQGEHKPTYNEKSDERINVTNYINWLDQDRSAKPAAKPAANKVINGGLG